VDDTLPTIPSPSPLRDDPAPGSLFAGRYRIRGLLGRGGFGGVYRAWDERLERTVALKILSPGAGGTDLERLLSEARAVARLDHPHIVPVYDAGVEQGFPWFSTRLVEGPSLKEYLVEHGPLPPATVLRLLVQSSSALAHAHGREIVHRDLKPGNLLLEERQDGSEHLWVADFGIAKTLRKVAESTGRVIGTPSYVAPEQVNGLPLDGRADVFSLGCVAAELLTGRCLFDGSSVVAILHAIVHDNPSLAEVEVRAGAAVAAMVRRCLAKSPADRWQTMRELEAGLKALAGGAPVRRSQRFAWRLGRRRSRPGPGERPVEMEGVCKRYGFGRPVLDGIDLKLERGTVYALLGRNGCGKTTLVRTLLGIYQRDAGRIAIFGGDPSGGSPEILARVGFVPDVLAVDEGRRVREVLDFTAHFYPRWDRAWCHQLLARYDLPWEAKIRTLSRGMRTKVSLVLALAHRPDLLVLDDATFGLDAIVLAELIETIQEVVRGEGATALLASHNYEEIERVATHVGLLRNGRIELSTSLDYLRRRVCKVHLTFPHDIPDLCEIRDLRVAMIKGREVTGWVADAPRSLEVLRAMAPQELIVRELSLREMFVTLLR
jgi:ABC-type multidrug transport system ATPase subunit